MSEKLFSVQEVISMTAKAFNLNAQDLISKIKEQDLSSVDSLQKFISTFAVEKINDVQVEGVNKGFRQAAKKIENLYADSFNEPIGDKKLDDVVSSLKQKITAAPKDESKPITLKAALEIAEVKEFVEGLKLKATEADKAKADFDNYKKNIALKNNAIEELKKAKLQFSNNPNTRALQEEALEKKLANLNFKTLEDGSIQLLDEDGTPKFNKAKGDKYTFSDYLVETVNFLDTVSQEQPTATPNTPYVPNKTEQNSTFGFPENHVFKSDDYIAAVSKNEMAKSEFIMKKLNS